MSPEHCIYLQDVVYNLRQLPSIHRDPFSEIKPFMQPALTLAMLDLEPARNIISSYYSNRKGGKRPRDPIAMLRSIILMSSIDQVGPNSWAEKLKNNPVLCILAGFSHNDHPGVGTFYDFFNRILDGPWQPRCVHNRRPSDDFKGKKGLFRRNLYKEKEETKETTQAELAMNNETRVQNLVRKALDNLENSIAHDALHRIEQILFTCAVVPSARIGLLGKLSALDVASDGSSLPSGANGNGRALCQCRSQGGFRCDCDRFYTDPDARWGYDSYKKVFYFGHRLHAMVVKNGEIELPVHLMVDAANTPDVVMGVDGTTRFYKLLRQYLPNASILHSIFDAGYDATDFHRLQLHLSEKPVIVLNEKNFAPSDDAGCKRDDQGRPLCPGGAVMRLHCYNKREKVRVFNCPAKRATRESGKFVYRVNMDFCPLGKLCNPESSMGPFVYLRPGQDPRRNPVVARNSEEYKKVLKKRTCTERFNSFLKEARGLGKRPYRRKHLFLIMGMCHSLERHAMEWVKLEFGKERPENLKELLFLYESLLKKQEVSAEAA